MSKIYYIYKNPVFCILENEFGLSMIEIKINEFTRRFLLLINFLGNNTAKNEKFLKTKKRFLKLYYLSMNSKILDKVLEILSIEKSEDQERFRNKLKDTFFIFLHGVYLKNFANKISESIRLDLIRIERDGRSFIYYLTKKGLELVKSIIKENNSSTQEYISNLKKMNPLKEISTKIITNIIDKLIKKKTKEIGTRV